MILLMFLAVLGVIVGLIAERRGHSFFPWFVFGCLLFIVALPVALMLKPVAKVGETRQCPWCLSIVPVAAAVCSRCAREMRTVASWQTDPVGHHQWRWWDGGSWTALVSDAGVESEDPIGAG